MFAFNENEMERKKLAKGKMKKSIRNQVTQKNTHREKQNHKSFI